MILIHNAQTLHAREAPRQGAGAIYLSAQSRALGLAQWVLRKVTELNWIHQWGFDRKTAQFSCPETAGLIFPLDASVAYMDFTLL